MYATTFVRRFVFKLAGLIALAALAAGAAFAQSGAAEREGRALRIGIIGAGNMGGPLGLAWAEAGHQIVWGTRNPAELMPLVQQASPRASAGYADAAAFFGDVVLLAVPRSQRLAGRSASCCAARS